jgi:GR25 family glycosyltransferase involved in LPS biosynthesis
LEEVQRQNNLPEYTHFRAIGGDYGGIGVRAHGATAWAIKSSSNQRQLPDVFTAGSADESCQGAVASPSVRRTLTKLTAVKGLFVPALQAGFSNYHKTQGVALGYVIPAIQAENQSSLTHFEMRCRQPTVIAPMQEQQLIMA